MTSPGIPPRAITVKRRTLPEQLLYFAGKLTAGFDPGLVAIALETIAAEQEATTGPGWRDGFLHAIGRLDRLAAAHSGSCWAGAYEAAAAALREELKIAEDGRTT